MPFPFAAVGAAAATIGGALIGRKGQKDANKANREEAGKNRKFQERMRNTEWQAAVTDMKAAGINPAVAYSQGGASAPSGSVAAKQESETEGMVGTAQAVQLQQQQLKLLRAQTDNVKLDGLDKGLGLRQKNMDLQMGSARYGFYFGPDGRPKPALAELMKAEWSRSMASSGRETAEWDLSKGRIPEQAAIAKLFEGVGEGGAGIQRILPLLIALFRGR